MLLRGYMDSCLWLVVCCIYQCEQTDSTIGDQVVGCAKGWRFLLGFLSFGLLRGISGLLLLMFVAMFQVAFVFHYLLVAGFV